jgi:hypothetical protein
MQGAPANTTPLPRWLPTRGAHELALPRRLIPAEATRQQQEQRRNGSKGTISQICLQSNEVLHTEAQAVLAVAAVSKMQAKTSQMDGGH